MVTIDPLHSRKITEANVLLTFLIVWLHVSANFDIPSWLSNIAIVSVPCFFTISSFLYFISFDYSNTFKSYKKKLFSRVKSLLVPFLFFNLLGFIFSIMAYIAIPNNYNPIDGIDNIFLFIWSSKGNGPLWYLRSLFEFILVAPIFVFLIRQSKLSILLLIPLFFLCAHASYFSFIYWLVEIFLGAYIAIYYDWLFERIQKSSKIYKWGGGVLIISVLYVLCAGNDYYLRTLSPFFVMALFSLFRSYPDRALKYLAPYSFLIYCLHLPASRITNKVPSLIGMDNQICASLLTTILTIGLIVMIGSVLKRNKRIWKLISGGR